MWDATLYPWRYCIIIYYEFRLTSFGSSIGTHTHTQDVYKRQEVYSFKMWAEDAFTIDCGGTMDRLCRCYCIEFALGKIMLTRKESLYEAAH